MFRPAGRRVRRIDDPQISAYTTKVRRVPIRVVFAEDNYLVREVTSTLLAEVEEIDPVGVVAESTAMLRSVAELSPDAVLTDIRMPPSFTSEGIDAAKRIRAEYPSVGVVVLSQYASDDLAFELLSDGVAGLEYQLKERISPVDELVRALQEVCRGGSALDPKIFEGLMFRRSQDAKSPLNSLAVLAFLEAAGGTRRTT